MVIDTSTSHFRIAITGSETQIPTLDDIGLFLSDFATMYELHRLNNDPYYEDFEFSRFVLYRNGRPIEPIDKLYVERIRHESPIELVALIAAGVVGVSNVVRALVESVEKIYNFKVNRKLLEQNLRNAELDGEKKQLEIEELRDKRQPRLISVETVLAESTSTKEYRSPTTWIHKVERRLEKSEIRIDRMEIDFINPENDERNRKEMHQWLEGLDGDDND